MEKNILYKKFSKDNKRVIVGIDEAGRGPVIGPFIFGALILPSDIKLKTLPFKDSKTLTASKRETFYSIIKEKYDYSYKIITAEYLNVEMKSKSLNVISYEAVKEILTEIYKNYIVDYVYLDMIGTEKNYLAALNQIKNKFLSSNVKYIIKSKADSLYSIVSGASIIAKVNRDMLIDCKYGSGYPSDPETINYLKNNFDPLKGFDKNVRHEWATVKKYLDRKNQERLSGKFKSLNLKP